MRLSTAPDRDDERALATLLAGLDAGVRLLDTADVYCHDERDRGHNERLVATALQRWGGNDKVMVATKGGLTRPGGRWVVDASAKQLRRACEASLRALGTARIDLYQLHAPDPRVSLRTSVRTLHELREAGLIARVGLCNVTREMLEVASALTRIDAVQVELSPFVDDPLFGGVVAWCRERGVALLAHSPLGGPKRQARLARLPVLAALAERHQTTASQVALGWLRGLSPGVIPLPGPSREATARDQGHVTLNDAEERELDRDLAGGRWLRRARPPAPSSPAGEVVLLMGIQGAGKSTATASWEARGYRRLNRDTEGGTLRGLLGKLDAGLTGGERHWVLDNTYASRAARARVIEVAWRHGAEARCVWLDTPLADAQINAAQRLIERYGRLPDPSELGKLSRTDPNAFDPRAQFRFQRELETPHASEGFQALEVVPFRRRVSAGDQPAWVVQLEGVVRSSRRGDRSPLHAEDVVVHHERVRWLREHAAGAQLLGVSWQPEIAKGSVTREQTDAVLAHTLRTAELTMDVRYCPHPAGPPRCWCRPPLPGLVLELMNGHRVDVSASRFVGRSAADKTLAERIGFRYLDATELFG